MKKYKTNDFTFYGMKKDKDYSGSGLLLLIGLFIAYSFVTNIL